MRLKKVDLKKAEGHECPGIKVGRTWYLAKLRSSNRGAFFYETGTFSRQWYGLHFATSWGTSGIQFDAPGTNCSMFAGLWEIISKN